MMRRIALGLIVALFTSVWGVLAAQAQSPLLQTSVFGNGGLAVAGSTHRLHGTVGQPGVRGAASPEHAVGSGLWAQVYPVMGAAPLVAPELTEPEDNAEGLALTVHLVWTVVPGAVSYDVEVDTSPGFIPPVERATGLTETSVEITGLAAGTTYSWRVRAVAAAGPGPFSAAFHFTTATNVANDEEATLPSEFALHTNYPNPFNPVTVIPYELPQRARVLLTVYDLHGRIVEVLVDAEQTAGRYEVRFDARDLASGAYFYHLQADGFTTTRPLVLVK